MPESSSSFSGRLSALLGKDRSTSRETTILNTLNLGFERLPTLFGGGMDRTISGDFPFGMAPWKLGIGRKLAQSVSHGSGSLAVHPVQLDEINEFRQISGADCVGAGFVSILSTLTGTPITRELYEGFLQTALNHGLAQQDRDGIKVLPFSLNVFLTEAYREQFPHPAVSVVYRRGLSLAELSEIVRTAKEKNGYKTYAFLPLSSWVNEGGGHLVTLQELSETETTIYDPRLGDSRTIANGEFVKKWNHDDKSAIFVFAK